MGDCYDCNSRPRCDVFAEVGAIIDCPGWNVSDRGIRFVVEPEERGGWRATLECGSPSTLATDMELLLDEAAPVSSEAKAAACREFLDAGHGRKDEAEELPRAEPEGEVSWPGWFRYWIVFCLFVVLGNFLAYWLDISGLVLGMLAVVLYDRWRNR